MLPLHSSNNVRLLKKRSIVYTRPCLLVFATLYVVRLFYLHFFNSKAEGHFAYAERLKHLMFTCSKHWLQNAKDKMIKIFKVSSDNYELAQHRPLVLLKVAWKCKYVGLPAGRGYVFTVYICIRSIGMLIPGVTNIWQGASYCAEGGWYTTHVRIHSTFDSRKTI